MLQSLATDSKTRFNNLHTCDSEYSLHSPFSMCVVDLTITRCAGRFTPIARVVVLTRTGSMPSKKSCSITCRSPGSSPAWWKPIPPTTNSLSFGSAITVWASWRRCF